MHEVTPIVLLIVALFAASAACSWLAFRFIRDVPKPPPLNTRIRLRRGTSVYVCHVLGATSTGWRLSAPIIRSELVPLREAETFFADYTCEGGVVKFATRVLRRDAGENPALVIEAPRIAKAKERRLNERVYFEPCLRVTANGVLAELKNVSCGGALFRTPVNLGRGERVTLDPGPCAPNLDGVVVGCEPSRSEVWPGYNIRLRLCEALGLEDLMTLSAGGH